MSDSKKENLFANMARLNARATEEEPTPVVTTPPEELPPSPAPVPAAKNKKAPGKKKAEAATGKRADPNYCQANSYVLKSVRKQVDRALLDIDGLDYSSLVEELLVKWLKARRVSD